jgi:hypothetical protein
LEPNGINITRTTRSTCRERRADRRRSGSPTLVEVDRRRTAARRGRPGGPARRCPAARPTGAGRPIVEAGFAEAVELPIPTGKTILLQLTDRGRAWLRRHKVEITPVSGSLPHAWWQHRVSGLLQKAGFIVGTEVDIDGHRVDVVGERDGERVLVEIETGRSDWMASMALLARAQAWRRAVVWLDSSRLLQAEAVRPASVSVLRPSGVERWIRRLAS